MKVLNKYSLYLIFIVGIVVRIKFYTGHIFSDDAYYSYLSYTLLEGNFAQDYLGYPLFLIRSGYLFLTSVSFAVIGINEIATIIFPFLISILNLVLTYKIAQIFTEDRNIALISVLLMSFFPPDIMFASINFFDSPNIFFINLGIYLLYKSYKSDKLALAVVGGMFFVISLQIKETLLYTIVLLIILFIHILLKRKEINLQITIALAIIFAGLFIEGFIYLLIHNDFLYRFTILNKNYLFCYYDFFPYTAQQFSGVKNIWRNLFDQLVLINIKSIFLRRFYLFLPFVALLQSYFNVRKNTYLMLTHWFFGTAILLIFMTTSFTEYRPLDLQRSWYVFPLVMPMIILTGALLNNLKSQYRLAAIGVYIIFALVMCTHYEVYFNKKDKTGLKSFLTANMDKKIFTDHFTKYGVDLIRSYANPNTSERINQGNFNWSDIKRGEWILYNQKHIDELKLQNFKFPDFAILNIKSFKKIKSFGDFHIFERN